MAIFKRKVYDKLLEWKGQSKGKTAALVEGARRIGKTTVVKEFARTEYRSHIIIDFSNPPVGVIPIMERGIGDDFDRFFSELQLITGVKLYERESLIVFDEVQNYPKARQLIKYFVADGRYDYIETGSLISLKKNIINITIPSEERRIKMHPMDFEEYLWAKGDTVSIPFIKECFDERKPLGEPMHRLMVEKYREYMAVGGMPQAVSAFLETKTFEDADITKRDIWDLYSDDVDKIPGSNEVKVSLILSKIPAMLDKENKRFSPGMVIEGSRMSTFFGSLEWLEQARVANICRNVTDPSPIMPVYSQMTTIKTYLMDTGMLISKSVKNNRKDINELYKSLIFNKLSVNKGMFFENIVAQELIATGHDLYFHLFKTDGNDKTHEIDFLLCDGKYVIPIEVKSANSNSHASLDHFMDKYKDRCKEGYVIHTKDLRVEGKITYIPIYMTMFIK